MNIKRNGNKVLFILSIVLMTMTAVSVWGMVDDSYPWKELFSGDNEVKPVVLLTSDSDAYRTLKGWQRGSISADDCAIRTDPGIRAAKVDVLEKGTEIVAIQKHGEWLMVRCGLTMGWIEEKDVKLTDGDSMTEFNASIGELSEVSRRDKASLDKISKKHKCMGVTIAVIEDGEVSYTYEYGWANSRDKVAMTSDTKIRVASLSKVMIGMAALSLRDMGELSLDEDISEYINGKVENPWHPDMPITLRHMLTHTSTLIEDTSYRSPRGFLMNRNSYRAGKPGSENMWSYSNIASGCAGATIEYAIGMTLVDFVDGYYFDAMNVDASYLPSRIDNIDLIATLYTGKTVAQAVNTQLNRFYTETPGGNSRLYYGNLVISAKDYARLMCILMGDGSYKGISYMSEDSVKEMKETYLKLKDFDQCLVLRKQEDIYDNRTLYYHTGNAIGVLALASFDDESDDGVVVVTTGAGASRDQYGIYSVCGELTEYCYKNIIE